MKFTSKKNETENRATYTVTFELNEWEASIKSAKNRLRSNLEIPGFRKGKVPEAIVKKHLTDNKILNEAHKKAVEQAWLFAIEQNDALTPFGKPTLNIDALSMTEYIVSFTFDLKPEVKVTNYTNIKLEKVANTVDETEVATTIKQLQEKLALLVIKEAPIAKGDIVIFDFKGFKDGEAFAGGTAEDFQLEIGSNKFIPGFEEQMIGLKAGEEKDLVVTFPEEYPEASLAGQEATFKVNIKEVKTKQLPEINDDLAKDANIEGVTTLEQLEAFIKTNLLKKNHEALKNDFINKLLEKIASESHVAIPQSVIESEALNLQEEFEKKLLEKNVDLKQYLKMAKLTEAEVKTELQNNAKIRITNHLILEAIMTQEKIEISSEEVETEIAELATFYKMSVAEAKKNISDLTVIEEALKRRKVIDFLYNNNG